MIKLNTKRIILSTTAATILFVAMLPATTTPPQSTYAFLMPVEGKAPTMSTKSQAAPIATSGNHVYLVWPSNKTTADFEIMFKASTDNGKTFGPKINLSNSTSFDSERPEIAALGSNVYVTWWERNQTSNEPIMRVSNDNGKTFGEKIMLSNK